MDLILWLYFNCICLIKLYVRDSRLAELNTFIWMSMSKDLMIVNNCRTVMIDHYLVKLYDHIWSQNWLMGRETWTSGIRASTFILGFTGIDDILMINNWQQFESVKPDHLKKFETWTELNWTIRPFKPKLFELKPFKPNCDKQSKPLKPRFCGLVLVFNLGQNSNFIF